MWRALALSPDVLLCIVVGARPWERRPTQGLALPGRRSLCGSEKVSLSGMDLQGASEGTGRTLQLERAASVSAEWDRLVGPLPAGLWRPEEGV